MELNCFGLQYSDYEAKHSEIFDILLFSKGSITYKELKEMPIKLRELLIKRIIEFNKKGDK